MFLSTMDFAKALGVTPQTIREWHRKGLVIPAHMSITGRRQYTQEQVDAYLQGDFDNPVLKAQSPNGVLTHKGGI